MDADINAAIIFNSDSTIAKNLSQEVYTGGVSYQLTMAFGISTSITYKGLFSMAFVDASNQVLAKLDFDASELSSRVLKQLRLDYTVSFASAEIGQAVRVAMGVAGQGPSPAFTRIR